MHATITTVMISAAAVLLLLLHPPAAAGHLTAPSNSTADTEFIRTSCAATLYPDLCFASLSAHSAAVRQDPARLARAAIAVSLSGARRAAAYVANVSRRSEFKEDSRAASAVSDCSGNVADAVDEIRGSLRQMKTLGRGGASASEASLRFQVSNVLTWMSAALTDEETCTDGFEDVEDGPVKAEVYNRIADVKKITSNALALVNMYARKVTPP